jgi:hypothetical protein
MKRKFWSVVLSFAVVFSVAIPSHAIVALIMAEAYFVAGGCAVVVVGMSGNGYVRPPRRYYPRPASLTEFDRNTGQFHLTSSSDDFINALLFLGIVLLDNEKGKIQFGRISTVEDAKSLGLNVTLETLEQYNEEIPKINAAINDLASRGVAYSPQGVQWAESQWAEYVRRGVISEDVFQFARQILNLEKSQNITSI